MGLFWGYKLFKRTKFWKASEMDFWTVSLDLFALEAIDLTPYLRVFLLLRRLKAIMYPPRPSGADSLRRLSNCACYCQLLLLFGGAILRSVVVIRDLCLLSWAVMLKTMPDVIRTRK